MVDLIVQNFRKDYPTLVNQVYPAPIDPVLLRRVLSNLLNRGVLVCILVTILETIADKIREGTFNHQAMA